MITKNQRELFKEIENILRAYDGGEIDTTLSLTDETEEDIVKRLVSHRLDYYFLR